MSKSTWKPWYARACKFEDRAEHRVGIDPNRKNREPKFMKNRNRNRTEGPSGRFGFRRFGSVLSVYVYFGMFLSVLGRTGPNRTDPKPKSCKT